MGNILILISGSLKIEISEDAIYERQFKWNYVPITIT